MTGGGGAAVAVAFAWIFAVATPLLGSCAFFLPKGRFSGDPHLTTFDRLKYDCQAEGEFVIVKHPNYKVQARFVKGGNPNRMEKWYERKQIWDLNFSSSNCGVVGLVISLSCLPNY